MQLSNRSWSRRLLARPAYLALAVVFFGWTFFWAYQASRGILVETSLGRGEITGGLAFHQVWELVFAASVYGIRWASGVVLLAIALLAGPVFRRLGGGRRAAFSRS